MAKLEIPTRAFLEDYFQRTFPDLDFSRGSALNDLVAKTFAVGLLPLRHDIDAVKVNQSITNYPYMASADLDALAANWGRFRQTGSRATGTVRLYFDTVAEYQFNYLEFYATDGSTFVLQAGVRITATELQANRTGDNLYYADVAVISVGVGSRYSVAAGAIQGIRNSPPGIVRVENLADFAVTAPIETNADVVNSMFRNLGLRNLVSPQSIRAALFEAFPGLTDLHVAGPQAASMVRDLVTARIGAADVTLHLGAYADLWINTTAVQSRTADFSYLPSSRLLRLVSAEQAAAEELLFSFAHMLLTIDGEWSSVDPSAPDMDESAAVVLSPNGIGTAYALASIQKRNRYTLLGTDRLSGSGLLALPSPIGRSRYVVDPVGFDMSRAGVTAGDTLRVGSSFRRIINRAGLVAELAPAATDEGDVQAFIYDDQNGSLPAPAGTRLIPYLSTLSTPPSIGSRVVIPNGQAAGHYRLLAINAGTSFAVGNVIAQGTIVKVVDPLDDAHYRWTGTIPPIDPTVCWIHTDAADPGAFNQDPATWNRVRKIIRTEAFIDIYVNGVPANLVNVTLVQGLAGAMASGLPIYIERDFPADLASPHLTSFATTRTLYQSSLSTDFISGATALSQPGLGLQASPGDVLLFQGGATVVSAVNAPKTGGDGSFFTLIVERSINADTVETVPPLDFDIPAGTRFALLRNPQPQTYPITIAAASAASAAVTVAGIPLGLGDMLGQLVQSTSPIRLAGGVGTRLSLSVASAAPGELYTTLTLRAITADVKVGDTVTLSGSRTGTYPIVAVDLPNKLVQVRGVVTVGSFVDGAVTAVFDGLRYYAVNSSSGGLVRELKFTPPQNARAITFRSNGYTAALSTDKGKSVSQTVGASTFYGTLFDYDNVTRTWTIIPNDPLVDLFVVTAVPGESITVQYGSGAGMPSAVPSLAPVGYSAPVLGDVGKYVRQGASTGVLLEVEAGYIWKIKPLSDSDVFDQVGVATFVDLDGTGYQGDHGYGTLREAGTQPLVNTGTTGLVLHRLPNFLAGDTVTVVSRFPRTGLAYSSQQAQAFPDVAINPAVFAGAGSAHSLVVPVGSNAGVATLTAKSTYAIAPSSIVASDFVHLPNGPGLVTFLVLSTVAAGTTTLVVPGSRLGLWAMRGRALVLTVNGTAYTLAVDGNGGNVDAIALLDPVPVPLYPGSSLTAEIVEAYVTPYWIVETSGLNAYRAFAAPVVPEPIGLAGTGTQSASNAGTTFEDPVQGFASIIGAEFGTNEIQLALDSGPDASLASRAVAGVDSVNALHTVTRFSASASGVAYHLGYQRTIGSREVWLEGEVVANDRIVLRVPDTWSPVEYGSIQHLQAFVSARDSIPGGGYLAWSLTNLPLASVVGASVVLDLAHVSNLARSTLGGIFTPTAGFDPDAFGRQVWVMFRAIDRTLSRNIAGWASNTFNYYAGSFMTLPLVKLLTVQQLSSDTFQPLKDLPYTVVVGDAGLRYSANENITLQIDDAGAEGQPIRITYLTDSSVKTINDYVNAEDTRVFLGNSLVKRMETMSVDIDVTVRSTLATSDLTALIAAYINSLSSTVRLSKDQLIRYLYAQNAASFIDTSTLKISGTYYTFDGRVLPFPDVSDLYGSSTSCYLSGRIAVSKLDA